MAYQEMDLSFGVEVECLLAFHESLLQGALDRLGDNSKIIKDLMEDERVKLRTSGVIYSLTRPKHMGWALTSHVESPADYRSVRGFDPYEDTHRELGFRPYADEVSHIAQQLLPGPPDVQSIRMDGKRAEFSTWYVSDDLSLMGVEKETMKAEVGDRITDVNSWDTHGVELVSRVLRPTEASFNEIKDHLEHLKGTESSLHGAFLTPLCNLHVHVGFSAPSQGQPATTFSLPTLQHLAYILVMYETEISKMHPSKCRAGSTASTVDLITNLDEVTEATINERVPNDDFNFDAWIAGNSTPDAEDEPPVSYSIARRMIFAQSMTIAKLSLLMCGKTKDHIVNFTYLCRQGGLPQTLEFRQHEGTLDAEAVKWWVVFVLGLVKLAGWMAWRFGAGEGYAGDGYPQTEDRGKASLGELWDLMGFEHDGKAFYERRMSTFEEWVEAVDLLYINYIQDTYSFSSWSFLEAKFLCSPFRTHAFIYYPRFQIVV